LDELLVNVMRMIFLILIFVPDETEGEVIDGCAEEATFPANGKSESKHVPEEHSGASSELTESDQGDTEIQSSQVKTRG